MLSINCILGFYLTIFALILIMISLILAFKENKFVQFLGFICILILTFYSKSNWCYLILIIFIALKLNLLDENFFKDLNCLKQSWQGNYQIKDIDNKGKENKKTETINETINSLENNTTYTSNFIFKNYKKSESAVVNWFAVNRNLLFEQNKNVIGKNKTLIRPDGIFENETQISILEVKRGFEKSDNKMLFKRGIETLLRTKKFYEDSCKLIDLYLAFVFDEKNKNEEVIKKWIDSYKDRTVDNIHIYLFEQNKQEVQFIEKFNI